MDTLKCFRFGTFSGVRMETLRVSKAPIHPQKYKESFSKKKKYKERKIEKQQNGKG